ncbi:MAG: M28 family peptidase [Planctomycetaceae bacterium]|nr:M28 family peptidase [Planctomycetaceae bacterium]
MTPARKRLLIRLAVYGGLFIVFPLWLYSCMIPMPGKSHRGPLPPLSPKQVELSSALRRDVVELAEKIGERNTYRHDALKKAADYMDRELSVAGKVSRQTYTAAGKSCDNVEVEMRGSQTPDEIVVVGGHYDSVAGCVGANDNGTGAAAVLALARSLAKTSPARTLRFVGFVNEEPPHFRSEEMGSRVYAKRCREREENIVAMLSLETIGFYSDDDGSQKYPTPLDLFYPSQGNFIAFVGNVGSGSLVRRCVRLFRERAAFPSEGAAVPGFLPGVGWSDHESFWEYGYKGVMVTDTAPFRYPHYHQQGDTPDKVDFDRCARVVDGVEQIVRELAGIAP